MSFDTYLGIAGLFLGVIGIISGYIFYRNGLRIKEPCFDLRHNNIINDYSSQFGDLTIKYKKKNIKNLTVSKILFWNNGKETIDKTDVISDYPVRIYSLGEILDVKIIDANNMANKFLVRISKSPHYSLVEFDYLDSQDGAVIQVIHTGKGEDNDLQVDGTIKSVKNIRRKLVEQKISWKLFLILTFIYI